MAPLSASSLLHLHFNVRRKSNEPSPNVIESDDLSTGAKVGIALGVSIPIVLIGLVVIYLYIHNWRIPQNLKEKMRLPRGRRSVPSSTSWQRVASVTQKSENSGSLSDFDQKSKAEVEVESLERPVPGKWWSAEEIGTAGEKRNTGRSVFSMVTPASPRGPKVVKAPRPPSIFTTKTSIYGVERSAEPEVIRPSSRRVKTWSRHISTQFMDFGKPSAVKEEGENVLAETLNKRNSKSVITDLSWQEYEPKR
jgi:hypothetical protein